VGLKSEGSPNALNNTGLKIRLNLINTAITMVKNKSFYVINGGLLLHGCWARLYCSDCGTKG
jgi:hypothetical protein